MDPGVETVPHGDPEEACVSAPKAQERGAYASRGALTEGEDFPLGRRDSGPVSGLLVVVGQPGLPGSTAQGPAGGEEPLQSQALYPQWAGLGPISSR